MGKLIVIEGLDGSGKGTQAKHLAERLEKKGKKVRILDFPNYKGKGSALVKLYLGGELGDDPEATNAYAASCFFAADRYISYVTEWKREFESEDTVFIANRYTTANAYHQLSKMKHTEWDAFLEWLWDFELCKLGLPRPESVILLDMPDSVSSALVRSRSKYTGASLDIHEKDEEYLKKCREAAMYTARKCGWHIVKCADENADTPYPMGKITDLIEKTMENVL